MTFKYVYFKKINYKKTGGKMKKLLTIVALILSTFLFGELDNFTIVNPDNSNVKISNNCFVSQNNTFFFTYRQKNTNDESIILSKSTNLGENYTYKEIYTANELSEPNITIFNNKIIVFFADKNTGQMIRAISDNDGEDFTLNENTDSEIYNSGTEIVANNKLNVLYQRGRTLPASRYSLFFDNSIFENGSPVPYTGYHSINGKFHSNTNIEIINTSGTSNPDAPGWPLFLGYTSTSGTINYQGDNPPISEIFQGGYSENVAQLQFNKQDLLLNSIHPFGTVPNENFVIYMRMTGNSCVSYIGQIQSVGIDTLVIYDSYPPYGPVGDSIGVNYVPVKDTVWTQVDIPFQNNQSIYVPDVLYLQGSVSGKHTIYSYKSTYLTGDITYTGTNVGEAPDDVENPNENDFFGLISNDKIYISYGYFSPELGTRQKVNCNGINLYGSYAAIKDNDDPVGNSVFTFEYQHPHPSTEPCVYNNESYDKIDLHMHKFPQDADNPWPADLDYPYYNPLWPESSEHITFERGIINLFGSVAQINAGNIHCSGSDSFNHSTPAVWDFENHLYGTTHPSTGYAKNYHLDSRLKYSAPPNFCQLENVPADVDPQFILSSSEDGNNFTENYSNNDNSVVKSVKFDIKNNEIAIVRSTDSGTTILYSNNSGEDFSTEQLSIHILKIINVKITNRVYILAKPYYGIGHTLYCFNPETQNVETIYENTEENYPQNIASDINQNLFLAKTTNENIVFYELQGNELVNIYSKSLSELPSPIQSDDKLIFTFDNDNQMYLIYNLDNENSYLPFGNVYISKGVLENVGNQHDEVNPVKPTITNYPNPFVLSGNKRSANTTFKFTLNKNSKVEINVYNLKGQKVAEVINKNMTKGKHKINWNARNSSNKILSSGIYFYEYRIDNKVNSVKKCIIIK